MFQVIMNTQIYAAAKEIEEIENQQLNKAPSETKSTNGRSKSSLYVWHERFGHQNIEHVKRILRSLDIQLTTRRIFFAKDA